MTWLRFIVIASLVAAIGVGLQALRSHLIGIGEAIGEERVQGRWDKQKLIDSAETQRLARERAAEQAERDHNAQRNANEQAQREEAARRRIAAGNAVAERLRRTIDALNQRDLSAAGGDPRSAALAAEAAAARQLFGSCSERYRGLAADADILRDQVIGLQADAMFVCRPSKYTNTGENELGKH